MKDLARLLEPGRIGNCETNNRITMAPMETNYYTFHGGPDGELSDRLINFFVARAREGVGLIVTQNIFPCGRGYPGKAGLYDDKFIPGVRRLTEAVHGAGCKIFLQLNPGRGRRDMFDPVAVSEVVVDYRLPKPRILTTAEIESFVEQFAEGARRAREAGADGIEIHGTGGFLVMDFLSLATNHRTDRYGGDARKRAQFAVDLVRLAKERAGRDFPLIFRLCADEGFKGGFTPSAAQGVCKLLEKAGADAIDTVSGSVRRPQWFTAPPSVPHGYNVRLAAAIKSVVGIPVMVAGKLNDLALAEQVLEEGKADFIDLGRALLADPAFVRKALTGRTDEIRPCICCNNCRENTAVKFAPLECTVNPACGNEGEWERKLARPVARAKRVLVIGGGPAGMQAAIVASLRGHTVTLWEKSDKLGGKLDIASVPPYKEELRALVKYLAEEATRRSVAVAVKKEATLSQVAELKPDAVIVATGARALVPKIPGLKEVQDKVVTAEEALAGAPLGNRVLILGGELVGCETAEYLADRGKRVTVVRRGKELATGMSEGNRVALLERLKKKGVNAYTGLTYEAIDSRGLVAITAAGKRRIFPADSIVLATGFVPQGQLYQELKDKIPECYAVGDCVEPRDICEAIHEASEIAMRL